jgi:hypothetical protein
MSGVGTLAGRKCAIPVDVFEPHAVALDQSVRKGRDGRRRGVLEAAPVVITEESIYNKYRVEDQSKNAKESISLMPIA